MNAQLARAALDLVGVRYRLHGRDRDAGVDCVGLVALAMREAGYRAAPPTGYRLRHADTDALARIARQHGFIEVPGNGDLVLALPNPVQPHLLVRTDQGFVHAHAGLRRVTLLAGDLPWPVAGEWRLDAR
ncbi:peptidoglycan endopeptidase [Novosphingobium huizhouense]|uniref:peptidoglycan endopeptidase n=1 Tax=Novosphingobium huizhouense TaxID=2866625 RepID=UPI001CD86ADE|nr:peptidoglycan endopeptidase [Novosphingobium huizhouense]